MGPDDGRRINRLGAETSPYLLQHAHNPVDWYPWGEEALAKARAEDKPIFLSIGYSACHWCHVMERESFEDPQIAAFLNQHFVSIKVDREERPDLDQIYMAAVQVLTGRGGWPMSVFLTPELKPFYGGTYFPPRDGRGLPGFDRVLGSVIQAWRERRQELARAADGLTEQLAGLARAPDSDGDDNGDGEGLDHTLLDQAARGLARAFDPLHGGFGSAPKFPHPMDLKLLLRQHARTGDVHALHMVRLTLDRMARGGIYDHLGGGFARYATDDRWLVPHFEKMLYDNALLASVYLEAYQVTHDPQDARVARETLDYVLERLASPEGGFYATEDADSEGQEGRYYVWNLGEIEHVLGSEKAQTFAYVYDVSEEGNWEGWNILNLPKPIAQAAKLLGRDPAELEAELTESRARLRDCRRRRVPPGLDTKILAAWNGLMLAALAPAGLVLREPRYTRAAEAAAGFLLDRMRRPDGALWHSYAAGQPRIQGFLDDYACVIDGLTRLFEATGTARWIEAAVGLAERMIARFEDAAAGGFFFTPDDHEGFLIVRPKELLDQATPSGNAMAATALLRLAALTGRAEFHQRGRSALRAVAPILKQYPAAAGQSLIALDFLLAPPQEYAILAGDDPAEFLEVRERLAARFLPHAVFAPAAGPVAPELARRVPLLADRLPVAGRTTTYVCERFACKAPIVGLEL